MANKEYYEQWLKLKEAINLTFEEDHRLQELAVNNIGLKPQATAVEVVSRVYCKYCDVYNKLCDCYDQMEQVQRRPYIKNIIDGVTCRLLELKRTLEDIEVFEYTYPDNALKQLLITPQNIEILCPFFYPFETRQQEMQYIVDQILEVGNRLGDPPPSASELELREQRRLEAEALAHQERQAEITRMLALGIDIEESVESVVLTPQQQEENRRIKEYQDHLNNIQRMERARVATRQLVNQANKAANLYIEVAGTKLPPAPEELRTRAALLIERVYRTFMAVKRDQFREKKMREKLGMTIPAFTPLSAKVQLEKVKQTRREFRKKYYEKWLKENIKENTRVLRLREGDAFDDISAEIRQWFEEWFDEVKLFDEYPWPEEGGTILLVRGETFSIPEFLEWQTAELKRLKAEAGAPKSADQKKAEKIAAREEKKRLALEAKEKEKKALEDYRKARLNPDNDPGILLKVGPNLDRAREAWNDYQGQWKDIDTRDAPLNAIKGHIHQLLTENAYKNLWINLRPEVDQIMALELNILRAALKKDYMTIGISKPPQSRKRKRPKKAKPPKPDKIKPEFMFQQLVDEKIIRKYPKVTLDDYWGDRNYAAADMRAKLWTPMFPLPTIGDARDQVRNRCLLTFGCACPNAMRSQLLVGPKSSGKRTLVYALATENNAILIDLSPMNVYDKFPGARLKTMYTYVNKISKLMQPTVILVDNADKLFYKRVPKEESMFDPTRLQKDFFKSIFKPIGYKDKILVLGTASEPWLAKAGPMYKVFPDVILLPRTDYGSLSYVLSRALMKYHGVRRDFNVHSLAQACRGYDIPSIKRAIESVLSAERQAALYHTPLAPAEVLRALLQVEGSTYTDAADMLLFHEWYMKYSAAADTKYRNYMEMLASQLKYYLKAQKK